MYEKTSAGICEICGQNIRDKFYLPQILGIYADEAI